MTDTIPNAEAITTIPDLMTAIAHTFEVEVPQPLVPEHPLFAMWAKTITVTSGTPPEPRYAATGNITDIFPFDFAQAAEKQPVLNLKIEVFKPVPPPINSRGIKVTVFPVPQSAEHPNGVIVKRGVAFVDAAGNPVLETHLSTSKFPAVAVVPPEAKVNLCRLTQP